MDYKQIITDLLAKQYEKLNNNFNINAYKSIKDAIILTIEDLNNINQLSNIEIDFITNNKLKELLNALKVVSKVRKKILDETLDKDEINTLLTSAKDILIANENEYNEKLNNLNMISTALDNPTIENTKILIEFVQECHKNKELSELEAINLIIELSRKTINSLTNTQNTFDDSNEIGSSSHVIVHINEQPLENLEELFSTYGYSYDLIHEKERKKIAKYGQLENIKYVLQLLNTYNISLEIFLARDKQITELMVFFDKEGLNNIETFLKNNKCSLDFLLSLPAIFYSRKRKFAFKRKNNLPGGIIIEPPRGLIKPIGGYENFLYCAELIRKSKGYADDYELTDEDFQSRADGKGMNVFLTTATETIKNNIEILKRYKLIKEDKLPYIITSLIGSNTEYLLDRLIEAGLYEYATKNMSFLGLENSFPFKWYKIKRALDTNQELYYNNSVNNGLKKIFRSDKETFMGISSIEKEDDENNTIKTIIQKVMPTNILKSLARQIPKKYQVDSLGHQLTEEEVANQTFNQFYRYQVFSPISTNYENGFKIEEIFGKDYNNPNSILNNIEEDEMIKVLDSLELPLSNGDTYRVKRDDLTYVFYKQQDINGWPEEKIIVSRQKVLRLCTLLKKHNLWMNKNMSDIENTNILLSVLLKDSIVSAYQVRALKELIPNIISTYKKNIGGMHR